MQFIHSTSFLFMLVLDVKRTFGVLFGISYSKKSKILQQKYLHCIQYVLKKNYLLHKGEWGTFGVCVTSVLILSKFLLNWDVEQLLLAFLRVRDFSSKVLRSFLMLLLLQTLLLLPGLWLGLGIPWPSPPKIDMKL